MSNAATANADGQVKYRSAKTWEIIASSAVSGTNICMYLCMVYASYAGSEGFGILTAVVGVILSVMRIFDGFTDTIAAYVFEKFPTKYGKCRPFLLVGWAVEALGVWLMYNTASGAYSGVKGVVMFILVYIIYITGYTINNVAGTVIPTIVTNNPKQRPMMSFVSTLFSYGVPILMSNIVTFYILPKYNNQYNMPELHEMTTLYLIVAFIFTVISMIGIRRMDTDEVWKEASAKISDDKANEQKVGLKEMWAVLSKNKDVQRYIVTCATDKFAQVTASQSVITTMLSGVLIGSYAATQVAGNWASAIGLIFAFGGGVIIGKIGAKKGTVWFSWLTIAVSIIQIAICLILGPDGMREIGNTKSWCFILWVVCSIGMTAGRMLLAVASMTMRADVVDAEEYRSGNFLPSVVAGVYSIFDKSMTAICSTIATIAISFIGYANSVPQMGNTVTNGIFYMTIFLSFVLPILGFVCNLFAMKNYTLTPERMKEIQIANQKKRDEASVLLNETDA